MANTNITDRTGQFRVPHRRTEVQNEITVLVGVPPLIPRVLGDFVALEITEAGTGRKRS